MKNVKLANFNNPKWTWDELKQYSRKYREMLTVKNDVPRDIKYVLTMYQSQRREHLISNLQKVQKYLYKE